MVNATTEYKLFSLLDTLCFNNSLVNIMFQQLLGSTMEVYIDDMVVKSK